jgi:hypothetical protein
MATGSTWCLCAFCFHSRGVQCLLANCKCCVGLRSGARNSHFKYGLDTKTIIINQQYKDEYKPPKIDSKKEKHDHIPSNKQEKCEHKRIVPCYCKKPYCQDNCLQCIDCEYHFGYQEFRIE